MQSEFLNLRTRRRSSSRPATPCPATPRSPKSWRTSSASSDSSATAQWSAATNPSSRRRDRSRTSRAFSGKTSCTTRRAASRFACTGRCRPAPATRSRCWCTSTEAATASAPTTSPCSTPAASVFAAELPALVLSVQYRLAPEHRLPAAVEDGARFLSWLRRQAELAAGAAEPWLAESADFARTFVAGVSAGANLAHHVVVRVASGQLELSPVRVVGYVLFSPFFGGVERRATESDPPAGVSWSLPLDLSDQLWRMALPVGATRDHPLANPFGPDSPSLEPVALPPVLVVAPGRDVLYGHVLSYAAKLKEMGKSVELAEFIDEEHGFSVTQLGETNVELTRILKRFVQQK